MLDPPQELCGPITSEQSATWLKLELSGEKIHGDSPFGYQLGGLEGYQHQHLHQLSYICDSVATCQEAARPQQALTC